MAGVIEDEYFSTEENDETEENRMAHQSGSDGNVFTDMPSKQPGKPVVEDDGSDYACVSWDEPKDKGVTRYEVKLKPSADDSWSTVSSFTDTDAPQKRIYKLDPATEYEFKVRAYYEEEEGPFSQTSDPVMTKPPCNSSKPDHNEVSSRKPGTPEIIDVGSKYISLMWNAPDDSNVAYYEIKYKPAGVKDWCKMSQFTDDSMPYKRVDNLVEETAYEFKVRAHYDDDKGPFSNKTNPVTTKSLTDSQKPGKPRAIDVGNDYICIVWDEPEKGVDFYEIKLKPAKDATWLKVPHFTDDSKPVKQICNLQHETEYEFKVRAHYENEEGPFSDKSSLIMTKGLSESQSINSTPRHPKQPGKPLASDTGNDYICLFWDKPTDEGLQYYEIKVKLMSDKSWFKIPEFTDDSYSCKKICNLDPGTEYEFKVRGNYGNEEGPYSETSDAIATKQPPQAVATPSFPRKPGRPEAADVGSDYISLQWREPQDADVTYYEIKTKQATDELWCKVSHFTDDKKPCKQIDNLVHGTSYEFKVRAYYINEEGPYSDTSDPVVTHTLPMVTPSTNTRQPGKPIATDVGSDYILVKWDAPKDSDVSYYEIKLKPSADDTWSKVSHFTEDDTNCKEISGLDPETTYEVKVRAHYGAEEGECSVMSDPITTLAAEENRATHSSASNIPGKPHATNTESDYVDLIWDMPNNDAVHYFEIKYKNHRRNGME